MPDNAHIVIPTSSTHPASSSRAFPPRSQSMYLERGLSSGSVGRQDSYDGQYSDEDGSYHQTVNYSDYEPQVADLKYGFIILSNTSAYHSVMKRMLSESLNPFRFRG